MCNPLEQQQDSQDPASHLWVEHSASRLSISPEHRQDTKDSARNGEFFGEKWLVLQLMDWTDFCRDGK